MTLEQHFESIQSKLDQFKQFMCGAERLARDPDLAPLKLTRFFNDLSSEVTRATQETPRAQVGFKTGNGIRKVILTLPLPHRFNTNDVLNLLKAKNFRFSSANPENQRHAVRDALFSMDKDGLIRLAKKGTIGKPNIYTRVHKISNAS